MDPSGKLAVVTGAGAGIGREICRKLSAAGARVVVSDLDAEAAAAVAADFDGLAYGCDVSREQAIAAMISSVERDVGPIDIFVSNAGVLTGVDLSFDNAAGAPDAVWEMAWAINVLAHVRAARQLVPLMTGRGGGYLVNTVSAAGLLTQVGAAVYSTTKHAAMGFAENLAITHMKDNIRVSVLCPQYVDTAMIEGVSGGVLSLSEILSPSQVADCVVEGIRNERFLILPHDCVADYYAKKAADPDRWIGAMAGLQAKIAQI